MYVKVYKELNNNTESLHNWLWRTTLSKDGHALLCNSLQAGEHRFYMRGKKVEKGWPSWPILLDGCWILIWRVFRAGIFRPASKRVTLSSGQLRLMVPMRRVSRLQKRSFSNIRPCRGKQLGKVSDVSNLARHRDGNWVENHKFWILILRINIPWQGKAGNRGQIWLGLKST